MVAVRIPEDARAFLILDDQGRPIGRVVDTEYALDQAPPTDTVLLTKET